MNYFAMAMSFMGLVQSWYAEAAKDGEIDEQEFAELGKTLALMVVRGMGLKVRAKVMPTQFHGMSEFGN